VPTRPVPTPDGTEHTRIRDDFELPCLPTLPGDDDPWVVLATISPPGKRTSRIARIDVMSRRLLDR
jgi:hypothetical protein